MPANDKSTQDYFGHAIILSDTHILILWDIMQKNELLSNSRQAAYISYIESGLVGFNSFEKH